jgi:uncharacterized membrane protein
MLDELLNEKRKNKNLTPEEIAKRKAQSESDKAKNQESPTTDNTTPDETSDDSKTTAANDNTTSASPSDDTTSSGEIYKNFKDDFSSEPEETKDTKETENGWVFETKTGSKIYVYKLKGKEEYLLSYEPKAQDVANKIIKKFGIKVKSVPTE